MSRFLTEVEDFASSTQSIVVILSVLTSVFMLALQYWFWLPLVENLRAKISTDRRVLNVIPFDWIMNDEKLYVQLDKLNV